MRECQIVSAPFPSGVAWLIDILLQLGVRTTHAAPGYEHEHWMPNGKTWRVGPKAYHHLRALLPALQQHAQFTFEPDLQVSWGDGLEMARRLPRPTILFTCDPRRAIYSHFGQRYQHYASLRDYLIQPATSAANLEGLFALPPLETWGYYHLFWLSVAKTTESMVVTLEQMQSDPVDTVRRVLNFIGLERTAGEIEAALHPSKGAGGAAAEEQPSTPGRPPSMAVWGTPQDLETIEEGEQLVNLEGPASLAAHLLGYSVGSLAPGVPTAAPETLLEVLTNSQAASMAVEARGLFLEGHLPAALRLAGAAAEACYSDPVTAIAVANLSTSLHWVIETFGRDLTSSEAARAAFQTFLDTNERFIDLLPIQESLLSTMSQQFARERFLPITREQIDRARDKTPHLVEEGYRAFNIVEYQGVYHGIAQRIGPIDVAAVTPSQLDRFKQQGLWVSAGSQSQVKALISNLPKGSVVDPSFPAALRQAVRGEQQEGPQGVRLEEIFNSAYHALERNISDHAAMSRLAACVSAATDGLALKSAATFAIAFGLRKTGASPNPSPVLPGSASDYPDVVLCNLENSGSSALDPVLRELLAEHGYVNGVFPHTVDKMPEVARQPSPVYHWAHGPLDPFVPLLNGEYGKRSCKLLYLYRDPRDMLVSHVKDIIHQQKTGDAPEQDVLRHYIRTTMPNWLDYTLQWLALPEEFCLHFSFEEMKRDTYGLSERIFQFIGISMDADHLRQSIERHSFEAVAHRARGEDGPTIRTGYMYRKGISGDWKNVFDGETKRQFKERLGKYLIAMGYEQDYSW